MTRLYIWSQRSINLFVLMMETSSGSEDFSDTIFWFLHENSHFSSSSSEWSTADVADHENEDSINPDHDEKTAFWHAQQQLLLATLCRTTPTESRVRQATEEALSESAPPCHCRSPAGAAICRSCSRRDILERLCRAGFQCSIRNSKWNKSSKITSGEHTYLEVEEEEKKKKGRVIVELHFRAEFEVARAGDHYNRLVGLLPEVYVGKPERLRNLVTILCGAAKRCMKENNMHVPPWRKLKYMQSKWFSASTEWEIAGSVTSDDPPSEDTAVGFSGGRSSRRPRASMLTFALLGNLRGSHCQAVAVV